MEAAITALLNIFRPDVFMIICTAMFVAIFMGILPGLGGMATLSLLVPFMYTMDPATGLAFLMAVSGGVDAGGFLTSILISVPGTSENVATCWDGFAMTKRGEAQKAIGIAATSSVLGGLFGIVILIILIPVMRPLVLAFTASEYFALVVVGLMMIASLVGKSILKGIIAAGLGIVLSFIGEEPITGVMRFTFGSLYLWDGIEFSTVVIGIYAVAEMIDMAVKGGTIAKIEDVKGKGNQWLNQFQGFLLVLRHWKTLIQGSVIGTIVGIIPGLGGAVANVVAYGYAAQVSKNPERFGKGAEEGIIASEASNNAKTGGALIPTLAFGIPGSAGMAILLGAFIVFGIVPGKAMLTTHLNITFTLIWTYLITTFIACVLVMIFARPFAQVALISSKILVPVILVISIAGSYAVNSSISDVILAGAFGVLGYFMKKYDFSRSPFIIGFILGELIERSFFLSLQMFGLSFIKRPLTLFIVIFGLLATFSPMLRHALAKRKRKNKNE